MHEAAPFLADEAGDGGEDSDSSTSSETLSASEAAETPDPAYLEELEGLHLHVQAFLWQMDLLCVVNFMNILVAYALTLLGLTFLAYVVLGCIVAAVYWVEYSIAVSVAHKLGMSEFAPPRALATKLLGGYKVLGWDVPRTSFVVVQLLVGLLEYTDPFLDAIVAASAGGRLSRKEAHAFEESWHGNPFGGVIEKLGLAVVLNLLLVTSSWNQLYCCSLRRLESVYLFRSTNRTRAGYRGLAEAYSASNLDVLANIMQMVGGLHPDTTAGDDEPAGVACIDLMMAGSEPSGPAGIKMAARVFGENVPTLWFSVSLLGLGLASGRASVADTAQVGLSVVSSLASAAKATAEGVSEQYEWWLRQSTFAKRVHGAIVLSLFYAVLLSCLAACALRSVGALACGARGQLYNLFEGLWSCHEPAWW